MSGPSLTQTPSASPPALGSEDAGAATPERHAPSPWLAMLTAGFLTLLVMGVLFPNLWYGMHDITDLPVYWGYASRIAQGEVPFTSSFKVEYPPLAVALFRVPGHTGDEGTYGIWFNILMGAITMATGPSPRSWPAGSGPAAGEPTSPRSSSPSASRSSGPSSSIATTSPWRCSSRSSCSASSGAGTPRPGSSSAWASRSRSRRWRCCRWCCCWPGRRGSWAWPLVAFGAAAVAPFLPYVLKSWSGVWHVFQYHLERPLQIESVLGTPQLLGQLLGADWAKWAWSHGSHSLIAPGVGLAADMSGGLTLLAVAAVYLFVWLRRRRLRAAPADQALVVLALLLALMTFGKVLSPQYFIWILPAWALVAARDRWIAVLGGLTLALTQAEFPALYWNLLDMQPAPLAIVVTRNTLLLATFALTLWRLWRLPVAAHTAERRSEPVGERTVISSS